MPGLVEKLTEALRTGAQLRPTAECTTRPRDWSGDLEASPSWQKLTPEQRYESLTKHAVREVPTIAVGTTEEVLDTLQKTKLSELEAIRDALPTRFNNASAAAAKLLEPKAQQVRLPGGTIKNEDDLKSWLADGGRSHPQEDERRTGDHLIEDRGDSFDDTSYYSNVDLRRRHSARQFHGTGSSERSPYFVALSEFVLRFASSARRINLGGLLRHRGRLHAAGLTRVSSGLTAASLKTLKSLESRDPNDLDVVTFYLASVGCNSSRNAVTRHLMLSQ